jgi:hypothetical protein
MGEASLSHETSHAEFCPERDAACGHFAAENISAQQRVHQPANQRSARSSLQRGMTSRTEQVKRTQQQELMCRALPACECALQLWHV